ncbi:MAG TPA: ABC transporter ATP-binding protein, partial [Planctomycetaceae bacterium]|nr:ABC transporter ATP-binding protein [Planctomycetaceae bacterium]
PELARKIGERFHITPQPLGGALRIERTRGHDLLRELMEAFPDDVTSAALGKPTLEDVFIQRTGHQFWEGETQA